MELADLNPLAPLPYLWRSKLVLCLAFVLSAFEARSVTRRACVGVGMCARVCMRVCVVYFIVPLHADTFIELCIKCVSVLPCSPDDAERIRHDRLSLLLLAGNAPHTPCSYVVNLGTAVCHPSTDISSLAVVGSERHPLLWVFEGSQILMNRFTLFHRDIVSVQTFLGYDQMDNAWQCTLWGLSGIVVRIEAAGRNHTAAPPSYAGSMPG